MRQIKFRAWNGPHDKGYKMHGYQYRKAPYHPLATHRGYVLEHRLIMENHLGRYLPAGAVIHHKNGLRDDNRLDNLEYIPEQSRHAKQHDTGKRNSNGQFVAEDKKFIDKKFRLYNKNTKQMQIFTLQKLISTTFRKSQFEYRGEFTGLKDKNGKEIYEGDVLSSFGNNWIVKYSKGCFVCDGPSLGDDKTLNYTLWFRDRAGIPLEIIGNIYENEDLLPHQTD